MTITTRIESKYRTEQQHQQPNYRLYLLLRFFPSPFHRSIVLFFIVLVNCVYRCSIERNICSRMPDDARIFEKIPLKCDKSNGAHKRQNRTKKKMENRELNENWMGIGAHGLSISRIISNWFGQMHFYRHILLLLFISVWLMWSIPWAKVLGNAEWVRCLWCSSFSISWLLLLLLFFFFVVLIIFYSKLSLGITNSGTGNKRLSCFVAVRQAITIRETKLTNNQHKIETFEYLFDWKVLQINLSRSEDGFYCI